MNKKQKSLANVPAKSEMSKMQFDKTALRRLFSYMKEYKGQLVFVVICILLSAIASAASSVFLQTLIDDYIVPLLGTDNPVFDGLIKALITIGIIYMIGVISSLLYSRAMVTVAQGTLKKIRDDMFEKMQRLPIRVFDTRTHGDIMSLYTNDTDTLRQMIAQSLAQLISSVFTIVAVLICMLYTSIWLTIVALLVMLLILQIVKGIAGKVGTFFMLQQKTLADINGYVEEMVNGQKVIKGGKSTLLKLIMRFWDKDSGRILLSGTDITDINTKSLRENESYCTQETHLFHDTIGNNIRIANLSATDEEIIAAAKKASIHDFIAALPHGYDTRVGELGDTLSGGEKQRISLARAFLSDAPLMLLDEPTSNLDSINEGIILKALDDAKDRTIVLVSHRKSTLGICDSLHQMENGHKNNENLIGE